MPRAPSGLPAESIERLIFAVRGRRVILDADLASLYGVPTFRFNEAFKRNRDRFPEDFAFQLTGAEFAALRSRMATSKLPADDEHEPGQISVRTVTRSAQAADNLPTASNSSQMAMSSRKHRGAVYRPWVFTEYGALMAANILRSSRARQMSVFVIRAFVRMRDELATSAVILKRLAEIDRQLLEHDVVLRDIYEKLLPLIAPAPEPVRPRIGFH
jgi:hypothetical protein